MKRLVYVMGLLVADNKTFNNGLTLSNFVISIRGGLRGIEKVKTVDGSGNEVTAYRTFYTIYYYASSAAYTAGNSWMDSESGTLNLTPSQIAGDVFSAIYDSIKSNYSSTTDI